MTFCWHHHISPNAEPYSAPFLGYPYGDPPLERSRTSRLGDPVLVEEGLINEQTLPPFQVVATTGGFLSDSEIGQLIADHEPLLSEGKLGTGSMDVEVRRSQIVFLKNVPEYQWLYARIWEAVQECNRRFFGLDIQGIEGNIQLARYDGSDRGFYEWHMDFGKITPHRKISVSIQLSRPEDYDGGNLELLFDKDPYVAEKAKGTFIAFPSFLLHRVTPVTRGARWSLVAWVVGARWR